ITEEGRCLVGRIVGSRIGAHVCIRCAWIRPDSIRVEVDGYAGRCRAGVVVCKVLVIENRGVAEGSRICLERADSGYGIAENAPELGRCAGELGAHRTRWADGPTIGSKWARDIPGHRVD